MDKLPLKEISIADLFNSEDKAVYEIPIYQRNYAWGKDEISALIQDVYDAYKKNCKSIYYIGTLVSYNRGEDLYEVIDGQQRLTTLNIILSVMDRTPHNKLTYRARKKSNDTIKNMPDFNSTDEIDYGILNGFKYSKIALDETVPIMEYDDFCNYFLNKVHIIHYQVPKDVDLNHYFEIMNSRGEQLEKHEIIKATLLSCFGEDGIDSIKFNYIWEICSELDVYVQEKSKNTSIFGQQLCDFTVDSFDNINIDSAENKKGKISINEIIEKDGLDQDEKINPKIRLDTFQPIIDFSNFLLIVLKLTRFTEEKDFDPKSLNLDDKELINEFDKIQLNSDWVKKFGYNLLKARFFLDNYIVHHSSEDDEIDNNPWMLQKWQKDGKKGYLKNLSDNNAVQKKLVQLLSMFEVSFTPRQRKNYLFYCLLYLFNTDTMDIAQYCDFAENLAEKYFKDVYMISKNLNDKNTPIPGAFDDAVLSHGKLSIDIKNSTESFADIYGSGFEKSKGIPLFVFNYLDYRIWSLYADNLRGEKLKEGSSERIIFFNKLGCSDFGLKAFDDFYFSRTRRSLEHYFPQANINDNNQLDENKINCLGNYAMIGSEVNSSGSNWSPKTKLDHYLDSSGKIQKVSVASLKFMTMMQKCRDNTDNRESGNEWNFEDITEHQNKMISILF